MNDELMNGLRFGLRVVQANKANDLDSETRALLKAHGLTEEREQMKPCKSCGAPRMEFRWTHITAAGHLFMRAMDR